MKAPIVVLALGSMLTAQMASAQAPNPRAAGSNEQRVAGATSFGGLSANNATTAPIDGNVFPSTATLPAPPPPDQLKPANIALPNDPIGPYLLTKKNGPFMVMAQSFRGPDAERYALALVLELRKDYGLPAYILRSKDFPNRSNIRDVPPTAPAYIDRPRLTEPEKTRSYDESLVLVGDEKTLRDQEILWHKVKKIKPKCLSSMPRYFIWREGLSKAMRTTNPFIPAQDLYAGRRDQLVTRMNEGPRSIYNCPGRYTLQIAEFSGRSTFNVDDAKMQSQGMLKSITQRSPLYTAHDDAERLANALAKAEEIRRLGQPVYVYHNRTSSRVLIGSFNAPDDPVAARLREELLRLTFSIMDTKSNKIGVKGRTRGIDTAIVPASYLTDLSTIKQGE